MIFCHNLREIHNAMTRDEPFVSHPLASVLVRCIESLGLIQGTRPNYSNWWTSEVTSLMIPAKKRGDTEIAERGRSVLVMHARYRSAGLTPHQLVLTHAD